MNNKGDVGLRDIFTLFVVYTLMITIVSSSANISFVPNKTQVINQTISQNISEETIEVSQENNSENKTIDMSQGNSSNNQTTDNSSIRNEESKTSQFFIEDQKIISQENSTQENTTQLRIELIQNPAKVGEKVKWTKRVYTNDSNYKIQIPKNAEKIKSPILLSTFSTSESKDYIEIEYVTQAPKKIETNLSHGKQVLVYSEEHYENVTVTTKINFKLIPQNKNQLKIYWKEESKYLDFQAYDTNNDTFLDQIEWIVPHLSNQTFEIILITDAQHLDANKIFLENIYNEVKELDDVWSPTIFDREYVRVTFEKKLDNTKDITVYPRIISGNPRIEIYEQNGSEIIAEFTNLKEGGNKVYLTKLTKLQDTFDLKILDGSLEFDYIVDPSYISLFYENWEAQLFDNWTNTNWAIASDQARDVYSAKCAEWQSCDINTNDADVSSALRVNVSFEYRDDDCDAGDVILYFNNSLGNWDNMGNIDAGTLGTSDDIWNTYTISTTDIQYRHSGFSVRFYSVLGNNENYWTDNINIIPLIPGPPNVTLEYPVTNYIHSSTSPLILNATVVAESELINCSLWTNHTETWHLNQTKTVTGTTNTTSFELNLPTDNYFIWNIQCLDTSGQNDWGDSNRSVLSDRTYPLISFTSPTENNDTIFSRDWIYAEVSLTETNFKNITFHLYNSTDLVNQTTFLSQTININWTNLPDETYYYNVTIFDIANNSNSTQTRLIALDTSAPTGNNLLPLSDSYSNNNTQNLTATVEDVIELKDATLFVYNSTGHIIYSNLTTLTGLTSAIVGTVYEFPYDGVFTWAYRARDSVDNEYNTTSNIIEIDTTAPEITFISPTEASEEIFLRDWILINTSITEENFKNITFHLYNSSGLINQTTFTDTTRQINFTSLPDGNYEYNVSSYDLANNKGYSETRLITLDTTAPTLYFSGETLPNNSVITGTEITAEVTAIELNEKNITFALYDEDGVLAKPLSTFTDGRRTLTWDNLAPNAVYSYNVTMADKVSLLNSTSTRKIIIDNTPPAVNFIPLTEIDNANKSQTFIFINTSITEENFKNITFHLYNSSGLINQTTFTDITRQINFTSLPDGNYEYNVTIFDKASQNSTTPTRSIALDTTLPIVTFIPSTENNDTNVGRDWTFINVSVIEDNFKEIKFSIYDSSGLINQTTFTDTTRQINFTSLPDGNYEYNVTVADYSQNQNSTETRRIGLDSEGPIVTIIKPITKTYGYDESLPLNHTVSDTVSDVDSCWWNIDGGENQSITCNSATTFNTTVDSHTIYFFANDTFGNLGTDSVSFSVSVTGPAIELEVPENNTFYGIAILVNFNFTASDPDTVDTCSLYGTWSGGWHKNDSYVVLQEEENSSVFSAQMSDEGTYFWNIECNDTVGYSSFALENYTFTIDVTDPQVFFGSGTEVNDTNVGRNWIYLDANLIETNFQNITFSLYNSTTLVNENTFTDTTRQINWTGLESGFYSYNITAYDKASNAGYSETRIINLDLIAPTGELLTPTNNSYSSSTSKNLTVNFTDATGLLNATLYILNATGHTIYSEVVELGGALTATIGVVYNFIQEGIYQWFYSIEDIVGNKINTTSNTLTIDTTHPLIAYGDGMQESGLILKQKNIFINSTSSDEYWENITFDLYDSDEHIYSNTFTDITRQINWTNLPDEIYFYNVTAYDKAGNSNTTQTQNMTLDNLAPVVDFSGITKPNGAFVSGDSISLEVSVTEANEENITFFLYNSTGSKIRENTNTEQGRLITWTNLYDEGIYYYNVTVIDKVGFSTSTATRSIIIDDTPPQVSYGSETLDNNSYVNQNWIFIKATLLEDNFQNITFTLHNSSGLINQTTFTDTTREINFTELIDATYWYNITTYDKAGNSDTTQSRYATLDSIFPAIDFTSPTKIDNFNTTQNWIYVNTTILDTNFQNITFSLYDEISLINQTTFTDTTRQINWTNLQSKVYWYNITTSDKASNVNITETRKIGIDYIGPSIQITSPEATSYNYNESIPLTYIISDIITEPNTCWYNLDNGDNTTVDCFGSSTFNASDGGHTLHYFANDTLGNLGYKNITFLISVTGPTILLLNPEDNVFYSQATEVFFNYTAEDPDLTESCSLFGTWNGGWHLNQTDYDWIFTEDSSKTEDFESSTFDNWTNVNWAIDSDQAIGTYSAKCTEISNCDMNSKNDTYASSATLINVTFRYRDDDCDAGDIILYFNNSLGNWDNMGNIDAGTLGTSDDVWNTYTVSSIGVQYQHPGFSIRFFADPENNENYWMDEIKVNYEEDYNKPSGNFTLNLSEEGTHKWNVKCNDTKSYETWAVANYSITFDVTNPIVDFGENTLPNNSNVSQNFIYVNSSITETNYKNITFYLYNDTDFISSQFYNDSTFDHTFSSLDDGIYYYNITVFDSANRHNSSGTRKIMLDTKAPTGNLISPNHNSHVNNATQNLTGTFSDENGLKEAILYIFNQTGFVYSQVVDLGGVLTATFGVVYEFLTDGIYQWFYQVEDTVGNLYNATNHSLIIDTTLPLVDFIPATKQTDTYISQDYIYLNTSVTDENFDNITLYLFGPESKSNTFDSTDNKFDINWTNLPENGFYEYNVTVYDKAGNVNSSETRNITLDNIFPVVNYVYPTEINFANKSQDWIFVNTTVTETNFQNITFKLYNNAGLVDSTFFTNSTRQINWTDLNEEEYFYNVTTCDKAKQCTNLPTRKITLDITKPSLGFGDSTEDDGAEFERDWIYVDSSADIIETNFRNMSYRLYNNNSQLINETTYFSRTYNINFTASGENKTYFYDIIVWDWANNFGTTSTRNITLIDTTNPSLVLTSPENVTYPYNDGIRLEYIAKDVHLDTCWYSLDGATNVTLPGCGAKVFNFVDETTHTFDLYVNDTLGYMNSSSVTFSVNSSSIQTPTYKVLHGDIFTNGGNGVEIGITDMSKSFILHSTRAGNHRPDTLQVISDFTTSENIRFENYNSVSGAMVEWSLISGPKIKTQRSDIAFTTETNLSTNIGAVNLSSSFIIVNTKLNSSDSSKNVEGFFTGRFSSNSSIEFIRESGSASGVLSYQIVSWEGVNVQNGSVNISDSSSSVSEGINAVDLNNSFLIFSHSLYGGENVNDLMVKGNFSNSSNLEFSRTGSTGDIVINYFVVSSDMFDTQRGDYAHSLTTDTQPIDLDYDLINVKRSFNIHSNENNGLPNNFGFAYVTSSIHDNNTIDLQKGLASGAGTTSWFAIEIKDLNNPIVNLTTPLDTNNYTAHTVGPFSYTITDESNMSNCSLFGTWNGGWHKNQTLYNIDTENPTSFSSVDIGTSGFYNWSVECFDIYGNGFMTTNRSFSSYLSPTEPIFTNITQTTNDGTGDIFFSWNETNDTSKYNIYYSSNASSFEFLAETANTNYTDNTFSGNKRRFYKVEAWNPTLTNLSTKTFGVHVYELKHNNVTPAGSITNRNWIGFPTNFSYIKNANETLNEMTGITSISRLNATSQKQVSCNNFSCPESFACTNTACNFDLKVGEGYEVLLNLSETANINWSGVGIVSTPVTINLVHEIGARFNKNWISMTAITTFSTTIELADDDNGGILNEDAITRWNSEEQNSEGLIPNPFSWIPLDYLGGADIIMEEGYEISVTQNSEWTQQ
ncbi:hypothetical protein KAS08_04355 [Candidatus Pacearchaeota archaeon]|nr:hypothetical protein [Candidatus Pacearchaeota archaeon]